MGRFRPSHFACRAARVNLPATRHRVPTKPLIALIWVPASQSP
nr:MAG TPA: hypothetical protein [Ackermannviridae sp. ctjwt21]